jgi:hypothetical protein
LILIFDVCVVIWLYVVLGVSVVLFWVMGGQSSEINMLPQPCCQFLSESRRSGVKGQSLKNRSSKCVQYRWEYCRQRRENWGFCVCFLGLRKCEELTAGEIEIEIEIENKTKPKTLLRSPGKEVVRGERPYCCGWLHVVPANTVTADVAAAGRKQAMRLFQTHENVPDVVWCAAPVPFRMGVDQMRTMSVVLASVPASIPASVAAVLAIVSVPAAMIIMLVIVASIANGLIHERVFGKLAESCVGSAAPEYGLLTQFVTSPAPLRKW